MLQILKQDEKWNAKPFFPEAKSSEDNLQCGRSIRIKFKYGVLRIDGAQLSVIPQKAARDNLGVDCSLGLSSDKEDSLEQFFQIANF